MIFNNILIINNEFFNNKFANKYLTDLRTLRIGNMVSSLCPINLTIEEKKYQGDQVLNFCAEVPDISLYAGVCLQRLFISNIANIIQTSILDCEISVINDDIIVHKEHTNGGIVQKDGILNTNYITKVQDTVLFYVGLYNKSGSLSQPRSFSLNLEVEKCHKLMDKINESYYHMVNSIYLKTSKI